MVPGVGAQPQFEALDLPAPQKKQRRTPSLTPADDAPIAHTVLNLPQPHLDRVFDYLIPQTLNEQAVIGSRIKVPFGAQTVDGYITGRSEASEHIGDLKFIGKVVSSEPVLREATHTLCRRIADRYCGTLADVLRLAIPPRYAGAEKPPAATTSQPTPAKSADDAEMSKVRMHAARAWHPYAADQVVQGLTGESSAPVHAVWTALGHGVEPGAAEPHIGPHWALGVSHLVTAAQLRGEGVLVIVPEVADLDTVEAVLAAAGLACWDGNSGDFARIHQADGPQKRYTQYLAASREQVNIVIGTRAAAYVPVRDLRLIICWDDGHGSHRDLHAPYPHAREILIQRAALEKSSLLIGGHARTIESQLLVSTGWAQEIVAPRAAVHQATPLIHALHAEALANEGQTAHARLPSRVWAAIKKASAQGPVLIQVPRAGYIPVIGCVECGATARCRSCQGPVSLLAQSATVECQWCGKPDAAWKCAHCFHTRFRARRVGSERTAEELGRAFPGIPIISSGARAASGVLRAVARKPSVVVATTGAEPHVPGGYPLVVILDAAVATSSQQLNAPIEALRQWTMAAVLAAPRTAGGTVLLVGDSDERAADGLVRWDSAGFVQRELTEREQLHLPPTVRTVSVTGEASSVSHFVSRLDLPAATEVLGPVNVDEDGSPAAQAMTTLTSDVRYILRSPLRDGVALCRAVSAGVRHASAQGTARQIRIQVDPRELL